MEYGTFLFTQFLDWKMGDLCGNQEYTHICRLRGVFTSILDNLLCWAVSSLDAAHLPFIFIPVQFSALHLFFQVSEMQFLAQGLAGLANLCAVIPFGC